MGADGKKSVDSSAFSAKKQRDFNNIDKIFADF